MLYNYGKCRSDFLLAFNSYCSFLYLGGIFNDKNNYSRHMCLWAKHIVDYLPWSTISYPVSARGTNVD